MKIGDIIDIGIICKFKYDNFFQKDKYPFMSLYGSLDKKYMYYLLDHSTN